jgi:hypothetical protein
MTMIDREVTIHAHNKKEGMTAVEIRNALDMVPDDMVPQVVISISGRIKTIRVKARMVVGE